MEDLKARYRCGGLGDNVIKRRLEDVLQELIAPIRARRAVLAGDPAHVLGLVKEGTARARVITDRTRREVFDGLGLMML